MGEGGGVKAKWLHNPCHITGPKIMVNQYGSIIPTFWGYALLWKSLWPTNLGPLGVPILEGKQYRGRNTCIPGAPILG